MGHRRSEDEGDRETWQRLIGRGLYPHQHAAALLNPLRRFILSPATLAGRLDLAPDMRVLELGCGPGYFSVELARRLPRGTLVLVDVQPEMLEMAVGRLRAAGQSNFETHAADGRDLPLDDASIDVAVLVAVLGEVGDAQAQAVCLAELHRVLKPGGLLAVTEQPGDPDRVPRRQLHERAVAADFEPGLVYRRVLSYTLTFRKGG